MKSSTSKIEETVCDEVRPKGPAVMIEILVTDSNEEHDIIPKWVKCE